MNESKRVFVIYTGPWCIRHSSFKSAKNRNKCMVAGLWLPDGCWDLPGGSSIFSLPLSFHKSIWVSRSHNKKTHQRKCGMPGLCHKILNTHFSLPFFSFSFVLFLFCFQILNFTPKTTAQ